MDYHGYKIETLKNADGRWVAKITRANGGKFRTKLGSDKSLTSLTTDPPQYAQAAAVKLAKQAIDGGGLVADV